MIGGKKDIGGFHQVFGFQPVNDASNRLINEFVLNMGVGINFFDLICCEISGDEISWRLKVAPKATLIVAQPMFWFLLQQG